MAEWVQSQVGQEPHWPAYGSLGIGSSMASQLPAAEIGPQPAAAVVCAGAGCEGMGRYRFNQQWACSQSCLARLLRIAAIEEQAHATNADLRARPRVQLGRILIAQGTINEAQLEHALRSQRATGAGRLGCWLKQQVELPEADFTAALSIQWHCPVLRMGNFAADAMVSYLPRPLVEQHGALPLRLTGLPARLSLGFEDHVDYGLMSAVERMHGVAVDAGLLTATEFWQVTRDLLSVRFPAVAVVAVPSVEAVIEAVSRFLVQAAVSEARFVSVHGCYWLRIWTGDGSAVVPRDVLCMVQPPRPGFETPECLEDVERFARRMHRVLE